MKKLKKILNEIRTAIGRAIADSVMHLIAVLLTGAVFAFPLMLTWNLIIPEESLLHGIGYFESLGVYVITSILFN